MSIKKMITASLLLCMTWFGITGTLYAAPQNDPVALMQYIADHMIAGLKENKATLKTSPAVVYSLANKYVVPYADLADMAKHVLPPQTWDSATPAQRAQFQQEFKLTLIRTYASSLTSYSDQTVKVFPVRGGATGKTVEVSSQISSASGQSIQASYSLVRIGNVWRLYDLSVEGVSMLESFRSQFADLLSQGNMAQLLVRMSSHNNG